MPASEEAQRTICNILFLFEALGLSYLFMFELGEKPGEVKLQVYGIISGVLSVILVVWYEKITGWVGFRYRYGWKSKVVVGIGMLFVATTAGVNRETTEKGLLLQSALVVNIVSSLQMIGPTTDFGLVNFAVRIPAFTVYKLWASNEVSNLFSMSALKCVIVYICAGGIILFHEYFAYEREKKERSVKEAEESMERLKKEEDATGKLAAKSLEVIELARLLEIKKEEVFGLSTEVDQLRDEKDRALESEKQVKKEKDLAVLELDLYKKQFNS